MAHKPTIEYGIIGLGRFGYSLATTLAEAKKEILVIDSNENKIKHLRNYTDYAFVVGELTKEVLEEAGIQNCQTVIIGIGEKVDVSILTTLNVISMGVTRVIAKAINAEQGKVLEKIGAEVIYPERDMAIRLANRLISSKVMDYITLSDEFTIMEFKLSSKLNGQTVRQADLRNRFQLNIIALHHDGKTNTNITPDLKLQQNDILVVVGDKEHVMVFESFLSER